MKYSCFSATAIGIDTGQFDRFRVISPRRGTRDYLTAMSRREAQAKPLIRSLMSLSVSRLVSIAVGGISRSTSVAMESRKLSRSSTSWRPLAVRNSRLARRSCGSGRRSRSRARPDDRAGAPARSAAAQARRPDRPATIPPAAAIETVRSIARAWCHGPWRGVDVIAAAGASFRRVAQSAGVSDRADIRKALADPSQSFQKFRILKS